MFRLTPARPLAATAAGSGIRSRSECSSPASFSRSAAPSAARPCSRRSGPRAYPTGSSCVMAASKYSLVLAASTLVLAAEGPGPISADRRARPRAIWSPRRGGLPRARGRRLGRRVPGQPHRVGRSAPLTTRPGLLPSIGRESSLGSSSGPRQERKLGGRLFPSPSCRSAQLVPRTEARRGRVCPTPPQRLTRTSPGRRPLRDRWVSVLQAALAPPRRPGTRSPSASTASWRPHAGRMSCSLAGELVANSVVHANGDASREIMVELVVGPDVIHVAVTDQGSPSVPTVRPRSASLESGRGLLLVEHLSDRWGIMREGTRPTRVWFEMVRGTRRRPSGARVSRPPGRFS